VTSAVAGVPANDLLRPLLQSGQASGQDFAERCGQRPPTEAPCGHELLGEERIAVGALEHVVGHVGIRDAAQDPRQLLDQLGSIEAGEVEPFE
jgi:hypothetical protein